MQASCEGCCDQLLERAALNVLASRSTHSAGTEGDIAGRFCKARRLRLQARVRPRIRPPAPPPGSGASLTTHANTSSPRTLFRGGSGPRPVSRRGAHQHALDLDGRDVCRRNGGDVLLAVTSGANLPVRAAPRRRYDHPSCQACAVPRRLEYPAEEAMVQRAGMRQKPPGSSLQLQHCHRRRRRESRFRGAGCLKPLVRYDAAPGATTTAPAPVFRQIADALDQRKANRASNASWSGPRVSTPRQNRNAPRGACPRCFPQLPSARRHPLRE